MLIPAMSNPASLVAQAMGAYKTIQNNIKDGNSELEGSNKATTMASEAKPPSLVKEKALPRSNILSNRKRHERGGLTFAYVCIYTM